MAHLGVVMATEGAEAVTSMVVAGVDAADLLATLGAMLVVVGAIGEATVAGRREADVVVVTTAVAVVVSVIITTNPLTMLVQKRTRMARVTTGQFLMMTTFRP